MDDGVLHALLRDDVEWDGERVGLALAADGTLALARVPAPAPGEEITREPPFGRGPPRSRMPPEGRSRPIRSHTRWWIPSEPCGLSTIIATAISVSSSLERILTVDRTGKALAPHRLDNTTSASRAMSDFTQ